MYDRLPPHAIEPTLTIASAPPTAAAALVAIASWTDLADLRRRDLAAAVSAAVRAAGMPPDAVLLTPAALRDTLLNRSPRTLGIGLGRSRNIRSGLRAVLERLGTLDASDAPLSPSWDDLLGLVSNHERAGFIGFARFCSLRQIAPEAVTSEVLTAFEEHLTERTLTPKPRKRAGELRSAWNRHCGSLRGWPATRLTRPADVQCYVLPLAAFPSSFRQDLATFAKRLSGSALDDPFDEGPPGSNLLHDIPVLHSRPLRPATVTARVAHCRWAASALVASGLPIAEIISLASLVRPTEHAKNALRFLYHRAGDKPSAAGGHVAEILRIVAKYHVRLLDAEVSRIKNWAAPVRVTYKGMTAKNDAAIRAAMDPVRDAALRRLPEALIQAARSLPAGSPAAARSLALRAVTIALLTSLPLRLANVVGLRLDHHLHRFDPKRKRISAIIVPGVETKTGAPITLPVAVHLSALLEEWITRFRGTGSAPGIPWLFPGHGTGNRAISPQGLRDAITDATHRYAGVRLSPHQFRHLAAHRFLDACPGHYEEVRQLLGHASITTTVRHYAGVEAAASVRRLDEILRDRIPGQRRTAPGRRRASQPPRGGPARTGRGAR